MSTLVQSHLDSLQWGLPQSHPRLILLPLVAPGGHFSYQTLPEALATGDLTVTEVSTAGTVPELCVIHRGPVPVLLLDGEELAGAKQNRVLNTSLLVPPRSEIRIPVSCTEQGRWSYQAKVFHESGQVLARRARARKLDSVSQSLAFSASFCADQGQVWHDIAELQEQSGHHSPTAAMQDVYRALDDDLRRGEEAFPLLAGQTGLIALSRGRVAGVEWLSLPAAYGRIHRKLVRSYLVELLLEREPASGGVEDAPGLARSFLDSLREAPGREFPAVGLGVSLRYRHEQVSGAALVHAGEVIHAVFLRGDPSGARTGNLHRRSVRYSLEVEE